MMQNEDGSFLGGQVPNRKNEEVCYERQSRFGYFDMCDGGGNIDRLHSAGVAAREMIFIPTPSGA